MLFQTIFFLLIESIFFCFLNGINNEVSVRELSDFHRSVSPAAEQPALRVDEDLGDPLADVLEDAMPGVLFRKCVEALVAVQRPNLQEKS